jgi:arylsulfatase A-like enzyme
MPFLSVASSAEHKKPNIVFFLVDDLGWRDAAYAGSEFYETPSIDQLARDGLVFTQGYVAYPRCAPSRYAFLTGRNPARAKIPGESENLKPSDVTVAEVLKKAGYATFFAGKWHISQTEAEMPQNKGFDVNIGGGSAGAPRSYFFPYGAEKGHAMGPGLETGVKGEYLNDRLTEETLRFLENHAKTRADQPFFVYLSHYAVHAPFEAQDSDKEHFVKKLKGTGRPSVDAMLMRDGETKKHQDNPVYAGMVASMDRSLGKVRETLKKLNLADNTVIIFTSDNGGLSNCGVGNKRPLATSNLPLRAGKGHLYEGGIRVPLIVLWPGKTKAGTTTDTFVTGTDHFPTMLELAGLALQPMAHLDGQSYAAALTGGKAPDHWPVYWYSPRPRPHNTGDTATGAIRVGNWKFIRHFDPKESDELFDLESDPHENTNLAGSNPGRAGELRMQLEKWLQEIEAVKPNLGGGNKYKKQGEAPKEDQSNT